MADQISMRIVAVFSTICLASVVIAACSSPEPAADDAQGTVAVKDAGKTGDIKKDLGTPADIADVVDVENAPDEAADAEPEVAADNEVVVAPEDISAPIDVSPTQCVPKCGGKSCGSDGCGGSCGECTDKETCSVSKCVTKPGLGCAGLDLKENWKGKFKGECTFVGLGGLVPVKTTTSGDMAFAIKCFNSKYLVNGKMDGEASGNKFSLTLSGTYDPGTKKLAGNLGDGTILLWKVFEYKFQGPIDGVLDATGTFNGPWKVDSTEVNFLGKPSPTTPPFKAEGTWSATGV